MIFLNYYRLDGAGFVAINADTIGSIYYYANDEGGYDLYVDQIMGGTDGFWTYPVARYNTVDECINMITQIMKYFEEGKSYTIPYSYYI